jgi:hypothetical protein
MVAKNFEKVRINIANIIRFWERFNLSLPGKITIYKTLLIPQINFIATVLTPDNVTLDFLSEQLENFVTKGLNIAKNRLYLPPDQGGVGLFDLKNFIAALQTSWIKRAVQSINDNWKVTVKNLGNGDPVECNRHFEQNVLGIGLKNIISSYCKFKKAYSAFNGNFVFDCIYNNCIYGTGRNQAVKFDDNFFGQIIMANSGRQVIELTWKKMLSGGTFAPFVEFEFLTGIHVSRIQYTKLKLSFDVAIKKYGEPADEFINLTDFFNKIKKGSKRYRLILDNENRCKKSVLMSTQVKTFRRVTETNFQTEIRAKNSLANWNLHFLPNRVRLFLFKYYGNSLGTGNHVLHFNPMADVGCVFCIKNNFLPPPIETFTHVFMTV